MKSIDVVIETPKGSTQKFAYEEKQGFFRLKKILPAGMIFPYDFGFIPNTKGEDGAPLDVIVLSEFSTFPGCMVECRLLGGILAEQTEKKKMIRNDRFVAVPVISEAFKKFNSIVDIGHIMEELEKFFVAYNELAGKTFKPIQTLDAKDVMKVIQDYTV